MTPERYTQLRELSVTRDLLREALDEIDALKKQNDELHDRLIKVTEVWALSDLTNDELDSAEASAVDCRKKTDEYNPNPEMTLKMVSEIRKYRHHATASWVKYKYEVDDILRMVSLFDHDMARPSSTSGELAMAGAIRWMASEIDRVKEQRREPLSPARFPLQINDKKFRPGDPSWVPWAVAELAYNGYVNRFGACQTLERLAERGGFGIGEMDMFLPDWRERIGLGKEIERLQHHNNALNRALDLTAAFTGNKVGAWTLEPTDWKSVGGQPMANLSYGDNHDLFHLMPQNELLLLASLFINVAWQLR